MHDVPQLGLGGYKGKGEHLVEKPAYAEALDRIYINKNQYFENVPRQVWEFHIGGYQVLDKYLKSRKSRNLVLDEVNNITNICNVLAFTITQMQAIDQAYKKAFPQAKKEK